MALCFPSCSLGSCRGQTQDQHGQFLSMAHQAGTLKKKQTCGPLKPEKPTLEPYRLKEDMKQHNLVGFTRN